MQQRHGRTDRRILEAFEMWMEKKGKDGLIKLLLRKFSEEYTKTGNY